ncbi:MAG: nucleotide pyrophosphohydrolase [Promethearchaeia archaeon]
MNDDKTTISDLREEIRKFVEERKWVKYHSPKNLAQAIQIEAAELSELFLFKEFSIDEIKSNSELLDSIKDEIADVFIYLLSFVNSLDLDLTRAFFAKMKKNKEKYPISEFNDGSYYKK